MPALHTPDPFGNLDRALGAQLTLEPEYTFDEEVEEVELREVRVRRGSVQIESRVWVTPRLSIRRQVRVISSGRLA